ncbi:hypothetical protein [Methanobrevibacter sp.]|nr:hypothetical protein [Methanobrevibacter sp.]MBR4447019.1 hypothetical protein [Methanobrevibacter sp.]
MAMLPSRPLLKKLRSDFSDCSLPNWKSDKKAARELDETIIYSVEN